MSDIIALSSVDINFFKIIPVDKECNMIDFAKENSDKYYDPDSGKGYYQFVKTNEEYISPKTQVVLVSGVSAQSITSLLI